MVEVGDAETLAAVGVNNPPPGLQVYVTAPDAVSVTLLPLQMVADVGVTDIEGVFVIVTVPVTVTAGQPPDAGIVYVTV